LVNMLSRSGLALAVNRKSQSTYGKAHRRMFALGALRGGGLMEEEALPGTAHCSMCHEGIAFTQTLAAIRDSFIIVLSVIALIAIFRAGLV